MSEDSEKAIRERAYLLWQKEGSPDGGDKVFWERARLLHEAASAPPIMTPLQARSAEEAAVDQAIAETFPASAPPAFAATTRVGNTPDPATSDSSE